MVRLVRPDEPLMVIVILAVPAATALPAINGCASHLPAKITLSFPTDILTYCHKSIS
jgi:hypothetical protein